MTESDALLELRDVGVTFRTRFAKGGFRAARNVTLSLRSGQTLAIVGESGSGKSTIAKAILGLNPVSEGSIWFEGQDLTRARGSRRRSLSRDLQAVFQDPYSSLNPAWPVGRSIAEPISNRASRRSKDSEQTVSKMLERIGLSNEARFRYPAEFSGGQLQRIAIARALISSPKVVVCDEPVSSLDVSVQAQILNLLIELQAATNVSYLFISHNLTVVKNIAHRVLVLYKGMVMEEGPAEEVCGLPQQPYTQALLSAVPVPDPEIQRVRRLSQKKSRETVELNLRKFRDANAGARMLDDESGCPFADRCPFVIDRCRTERPTLREGRNGVMVACHLAESIPVVEGLVSRSHL